VTDQIRDSLMCEGEERPIRCLPLDTLTGHAPDWEGLLGGNSSGCHRGYIGTWEVREDALHLVRLRGEFGTSVSLRAVFPACADSAEATWFTGEITPDDVTLSEHEWSDGSRASSRWFSLVVYKGKVLLEQAVDLKSDAVVSRLTKNVEPLYPGQELAFLRGVHYNLAESQPKLAYADWLEARGDPRAVILRVEAARIGSRPYRRRIRALDTCSFPSGAVDSNEATWFWRHLAGIPNLRPEDPAVSGYCRQLMIQFEATARSRQGRQGSTLRPGLTAVSWCGTCSIHLVDRRTGNRSAGSPWRPAGTLRPFWRSTVTPRGHGFPARAC
jgi:uncharacterized protein (TIGR02996 family)